MHTTDLGIFCTVHTTDLGIFCAATDLPHSCVATSSGTISGDLTYSNCSIGANSDSGCTTNDTNANSYGAGFASAGGGVYVAEYATTGIKIWFLTVSYLLRGEG